MPDDIKLPEPVAWTLREYLATKRTTTRGFLWFSDPVNSGWVGLYTADQLREHARAAVEAERAKRVPLTREQIDHILADGFLAANGSVYSTRVHEFARAIEADHGITEPSGGAPK